jgi:hypothetical protein
LDPSVKSGQNYQYRLCAVYSSGREEILGEIDGNCGMQTRTFAITRIGPNPASSTLNCSISLAQPGEVELVLYDLAGRTVKSERFQAIGNEWDTALNVSGLATGVYSLKASSGSNQAIKRIVIAR